MDRWHPILSRYIREAQSLLQREYNEHGLDPNHGTGADDRADLGRVMLSLRKQQPVLEISSMGLELTHSV